MMSSLSRRVLWGASGFAVLSLLGALTVHSQNGLQIGYGVLRASLKNPLPVAAALFSFRNDEGVLVAEAGVAATSPMRRGRIFVDSATATGLALVNPSDSDLTIALTLRNRTGALVDQTGFSLPARRQLARFVSHPDWFGTLPEGFAGSVSFEVHGDAGAAALTLRQSTNGRGESLFATLPVADVDNAAGPAGNGLSSIIFPQLGAGGGLSTELALINPGSRNLAGEIRLIGPDGLPLELELNGQKGSAFPYQLAPDGVFLGRLTSGSERPLSGYGLVSVEPGGTPPVGAAIFQLRDRDGNLVSEAGVGATAAATRARIFVDTVGTRTGVALASPGNEPTEALFRLLDRNGLDFAATSRTLAGGGQLSVFVDELFETLPEGFTGVLEIVSERPLAPVTLKLTVNERGDPILTTLPVADLTRPLKSGTLVFPQVGFGSGFSTRLILLSGSDRTASAGTLTFHRPDGGQLTVPLLGRLESRFEYDVLSSAVVQLRPGAAAEAVRIVLHPNIGSAQQFTLNQGNSLALRAVVVDSAGDFRDDFPIQITSLDEAVATVDGRGRITGRQAGFSTLTFGAGGVRATRTVNVVETAFGPTASEVLGVAQDRAGRLYLADRRDHAVRSSDAFGAGSLVYAGMDRRPGFRDGPRSVALFNQPAFLALNQATGTLYVSDAKNHRIRAVQPGRTGRVGTLAGSGRQGTEDGPVASAAFNRPQGIVLDRYGNLWVADSGNHTIRRIDCRGRKDCSTGIVETIAGAAGQPGFSDGAGSRARFDSPVGMALEQESAAAQIARAFRGDPPPPVAVLVADTGNGLIRRVREDGVVETVSTAAADGTKTPVKLNSPGSVEVDPAGNILIGESGRVGTLLRTGGLVDLAEAGTFRQPGGLLAGGDGGVIVADSVVGIVRIRHGAPAIEQVSPNRIPSGQRSIVTVMGRNFPPDAMVLVDGETTVFAVRDSSAITVEIPPLPSGQKTLSVQTRGGLAQQALDVEGVSLDALPQGRIATVAGGSSLVGDGRPAAAAGLDPRNLSFDAVGNLYVVDRDNFRIRRIDARTGIVSTVAGTGAAVHSGDRRPAVAASLRSPFDVVVDPSGNLFIADGSRVRRVDARTGVIRTVAGGGSPADGLGDGLPATEAALSLAVSTALDGVGNLFISDLFRSRIRRVDAATGIITTVAGSGVTGFFGDGGPAVAAGLSFADSIAVDEDGNLLIADSRFNRRIRRVDAETGIIATVAGIGCARDPSDFPWDCPPGDGGPATRASLHEVSDLEVGPSGDLFIADFGDGRVRRVDSTNGVISTVAGNGCTTSNGDCEMGEESPATQAPIQARAIAVDGSESLTIAAGFELRTVNSVTAAVETTAGNGQSRIRGDAGPASSASLMFPYRIAFDRDFNLHIVEPWGRAVRRIDRHSGLISTLVDDRALDSPLETSTGRETGLFFPEALALDGTEYLYFSDSGVIQRIDLATGDLETIASTPGVSQMLLLLDGGLAATIPDLNQVVRIDPVSGETNRVAGTGEAGLGGDGGPAVEALLDSPTGLSLDLFGNLLVADTGNHRIRKIDRLTGMIETVAGLGLPGFFGDGGPALDALLQSPHGVASDCNENIFIADSGNGRIRRVDAASGVIVTVAGGGAPANGPGDGLNAVEARLRFPRDLAFDRAGNLLVVDTVDHRIRAISRIAAPAPSAGGGAPGPCSAP